MSSASSTATPMSEPAISVAVTIVNDLPELIALVSVLASERNFLFILPIDPRTGLDIVTTHLASIAASNTAASNNEALFTAPRNGENGRHRDWNPRCPPCPSRRDRHRHRSAFGASRPRYRREPVDGAQHWARFVDCHRLQLRVVTANPAAIGLYRKLGSKVEGVARAGAVVDSERYDDSYMAKILD